MLQIGSRYVLNVSKPTFSTFFCPFSLVELFIFSIFALLD